MEKIELLKEKISQGFAPCFNAGCQRREHCLRWQAREYVSQTAWVTTCVNAANPEAQGDSCAMYRHDQPQHMAYGFTKLLDNLPAKTARSIMAHIKERHNRTYAYEFRNGTRPIPPAMQDDIASTCRRLGYNGPVVFDSYGDDYQW